MPILLDNDQSSLIKTDRRQVAFGIDVGCAEREHVITNLVGKRALVTGAASGIERAVSGEMASNGCTLLLTALEAEELARFEVDLGSSAVPVAAKAADLTDNLDRLTLLEWLRSRTRSLDILINNAGVGGKFGPFVTADTAEMEKVVALNVLGTIHLTHELMPLLRDQPEAWIVNISSGIARLPYPGLAVYGATKAFISSFSESLACELARTRIRVMCFHPGFTLTGFMARSEMDMGRVPRFLLHSPEWIAGRLVLALRRDRTWVYSDIITGLSARFGLLLPHRLRVRLFRNLFWTLPNE
ncbi:MAG: SDR family NAD(P)-dependent oxidoreductase [Verrucomicrobiae bacterium]|nr:SDR family NAD(P)-dependent oxidoreductase [Verrucomicrobiae bacterium]